MVIACKKTEIPPNQAPLSSISEKMNFIEQSPKIPGIYNSKLYVNNDQLFLMGYDKLGKSLLNYGGLNPELELTAFDYTYPINIIGNQFAYDEENIFKWNGNTFTNTGIQSHGQVVKEGSQGTLIYRSEINNNTLNYKLFNSTPSLISGVSNSV
jgi:hypothetical protein